MSRCPVPTLLTTTSYALLGLLNLRSWTTYELAKQAQRSLHWFWPRAERKLYQEPKQLVAAGLATATREATGQRPRTVYAITPDGRTALADWLSEPAEPRSSDFAAMVKVFFADAGTLEQLEATLAEIEAEARDRLDTLAERAGELLATSAFPQRGPLNVLALRLQVDQETAILRWAAWARTAISRWDATTDAGEWPTDQQVHELVTAAQAAVRRSRSSSGRSRT